MSRTTLAAALAILAGFLLFVAGATLAGGLLVAGGAYALILPAFLEPREPAAG